MPKNVFLASTLLMLGLAPEVRPDGEGAAGMASSHAKDFDIAVAAHFSVRQETIAACRRQQIPDDHLPVVFFLAAEAKVTPEVIAGMRVRGKSWMDIAVHFGFSAELFHVVVVRDHGPPYGKAFGYYRQHKRSEWAAIRLGDDDIVTLVNVKFLASHHGCSPDDVIGRMKDGGFVQLHAHLKLEKERAGGKRASARQGPEAKEPGAGGKKGAGKGPRGGEDPEAAPFAGEKQGGRKGGGGKAARAK